MYREFDWGGRPLGPETISMIRDLLREYCTARSCQHQGPEAEDAARRLVVLYQNGIDDAGELRRLLPGN